MAGPLGAVTGLARFSVDSGVRATLWYLETATAITRRLTEGLVNGDPPGVVLDDLRSETVADLRRVLGVDEGDLEAALARVRGGAVGAAAAAGSAVGMTANVAAARAASQRQQWTEERELLKPETLRDRGAALLARSATVEEYADEHPAYAAILDQLAPDEARILRLVAGAPQAIVDVVAVNPLGRPVRELGRHITMLGPRAGLRHPERTSYYLENLIRLALVRISSAPTAPDSDYDVLEAQEPVIAAARQSDRSIVRARVVRRTVVLTEFGTDFAAVCLPA